MFVHLEEMFISGLARRCVLKMAKYSERRDNVQHQRVVAQENRPLLRRLLNCKPCRQVIDRDNKRSVRHNWVDDQTDLFWKNKAQQCDTKKLETDKVQENLNLIRDR